MNITIYTRKECSKAKGLCVVIDVLRAFTTAAYAFSREAKEIILVSTKEEAFERYQKNPNLLLMGEEHGLPIAGFHFGNSPFQIQQKLLLGKTLVQRTSAGTQGVVACTQSSGLLLASFVVAEATICHIQKINPDKLSFIVTGTKNGDEDLAFAEYAQERLQGNTIPLEPYLERVQNSPSGQMFSNHLNLRKEDLELSLKANRFSFAMEVEKIGNDLIAHPVHKLS
jgi:2-phosphosulfolactate phosphatase